MQVRDAVIIIFGEQRGHGDNVLRVVVLDGTEYDGKKSDLIERLGKGEKLFVISVYQTIGAGQNLQYPFPEYFPRFFICTRNALFSPFISTFIKPALFPFILPSYKYRYVTNLFMLIYPPARFVLFYEWSSDIMCIINLYLIYSYSSHLVKIK